MIDNKIQIATNEMIEFACKNYHYSKSIPCGRKVAYAIFEESQFIGVIIYSLGANNNLAKSFGLVQGEVVELTRVALKNHKNPVSRYVAITLKLLKKQCKTIKLVVSYADKENQGHSGGIYQASNWIYLGVSKCSDFQWFYKGHWTHNKTFCDMAVRQGKKYVQQLLSTLPKRKNSDKHKYIYCFDKNYDVKYRQMAKPYPKNACLVQEQNSNVPVEDGGAIPTDTHQDSTNDIK